MIDYHIHLERGPYTLEWVRRFWEQAESRGLTEIGITEHAHRFKEFRPVYEHLLEGVGHYPYVRSWLGGEFHYSIEEYFDLLEKARDDGMPIKVGIEADFFPSKMVLIRDILDEYSFDYILGSVHFLDKWSFDYDPKYGWAERDIDLVYLQYIAALKEAVASGMFDIMSHLDVIKVFGNRPSKDLEAEWDSLLEAIAASGLCIEISTAGLRKPVQEIYPEENLIRKAAQLHIPITIASDAHIPDDVGDQWETAVRTARQAGYTEYQIFTDRRAQSKPLPLI